MPFALLQAIHAVYTECAEEELGPLLAERLSRLGLRPFDITNVTHASRQIEVFVHHYRLISQALAAPLRPLSRATRVLVAMCGTSEREDFCFRMFRAAPEEADPQRVRDFYGSNLAAELCCDGSHVEVCVRCATNRDPAFTACLASFLRAIEAQAAGRGSGEFQCDGTAARTDAVEARVAARSLVAAVRAKVAAVRRRRTAARAGVRHG